MMENTNYEDNLLSLFYSNKQIVSSNQEEIEIVHVLITKQISGYAYLALIIYYSLKVIKLKKVFYKLLSILTILLVTYYVSYSHKAFLILLKNFHF